MRLFIFAIFPILFFGNLVFAQIIPIENGKVYVCPLAKDLNQVNPKCDCRVDLILREKVEKECKIDGKTYQMFLTIEEYDGKEYYKILGFENGGAGINLPPEAKISGNTEGKVGETLTFDASLSFDPNADPLDFYWELEGKEKKEGKIVSFNFPTPGNFILKLTVSDGMEEHSTFAEISIKKENFSLSQSQKIPKETPFLTETPPPSLIENAFEETLTQTPTFFQKESSETKEKANLELKEREKISQAQGKISNFKREPSFSFFQAKIPSFSFWKIKNFEKLILLILVFGGGIWLKKKFKLKSGK